MFLSLRQILTPTPLEPLTYLRGYNHQGLSQKYVLGCDIPVYHSIVLALSMYHEQDFGKRYTMVPDTRSAYMDVDMLYCTFLENLWNWIWKSLRDFFCQAVWTRQYDKLVKLNSLPLEVKIQCSVNLIIVLFLNYAWLLLLACCLWHFCHKACFQLLMFSSKYERNIA